jgi:protein arginine N-methyltransferase 1
MLIEFHRAMLADGVRNAAFHEALRRVVVPGRTTVADIGCGTGLLAFLASRLGARQVHCYEHGAVIHLAERLARANGIRNLVFYPEHSTAILDPEPVDVVVSETLGNFAYEENILETLRDARRFLRPGGTLIPQRLEQYVAPVVSPRVQNELEAWDGVGFGLDLRIAKAMSLNNLYVRTVRPDELLDAPDAVQCWDRARLGARGGSVRRGTVGWRLGRPATVYGCEVWRGLDWMDDADKVPLDVGRREALSLGLIGVYDSQVEGGKRYDLATAGRRRANASYFQSHQTDEAEQLWFAMDLTPLVRDDTIDVSRYVLGHVDKFRAGVDDKIKKYWIRKR